MDFAHSGLPQDLEVKRAFDLLEEVENSWANENCVKIVRNITDSYNNPPVTIAAASLLWLYVREKVRETRGDTDDLYLALGKSFSPDVMAELGHIVATDMNGVLSRGETQTLYGAHPTAKIYAMGHALFMIEGAVEKGFNGSFMITEAGMSKAPPDKYLLEILSQEISRTAEILKACHGANAALEEKLTAAIKASCNAVDVAEDEILHRKRNWRDAQLFPKPGP